MKADIYVRVMTWRKMPGGMIQDIISAIITRKCSIAAVPLQGQNMLLDDVGRPVELGKVRAVNHYCQMSPYPFEEVKVPWVEVITEIMTDDPAATLARLTAASFKRVEEDKE